MQFSDIYDVSGLDVDIHFKVRRKRNGDFFGVQYKPQYLLSNIEKIDPSQFRNNIIKLISLRSKLSENEIEINFKNKIDKEYNKKLGIYIFNLLGTSIQSEYNRHIYDYTGTVSLEKKYPDVNDDKMLRINHNQKKVVYHKIPPFDFEYTNKIYEEDYLKNFTNVKEIRFFDDDLKYSFIIHNTDYKFKCRLNQENSNYDPWRTKYIINEEFYKLKRTILTETKKINLNIYDHLGNLHKYTELHKLGTINFEN